MATKSWWMLKIGREGEERRKERGEVQHKKLSTPTQHRNSTYRSTILTTSESHHDSLSQSPEDNESQHVIHLYISKRCAQAALFAFNNSHFLQQRNSLTVISSNPKAI